MVTLDEVIAEYRKTESINATAKSVKISQQTVRRMLIQAGIYSTDKSCKIADYVVQGESVEKIAAAMKLSKKCVQSYMPFIRGSYAVGEKTINAQRIADWRKKREGRNL